MEQGLFVTLISFWLPVSSANAYTIYAFVGHNRQTSSDDANCSWVAGEDSRQQRYCRAAVAGQLWRHGDPQ